MRKICFSLAALTLLLLLSGCAVRDGGGKKDSYLVIHSVESDHDTKLTPDDGDYDALLDGLFDAAGEAVGTATELSEEAVQTGTITYYQAPTRTVLGGGDGAYTPILAFDLYTDGGEPYAEGRFCSDEEKALTFRFPVPEKLNKLVAARISGAEDAPAHADPSGQDGPDRLCEDVAAGDVRYVHISGNASSVVIRRSGSENFAFYNGDLNAAHTYTVRCDKRDSVLDIELLMENPEGDNDVLGSPVIDIPQKEFEQIEVAGGFGQLSLYALNSDVLIHADGSSVYLDLEADYLNHDITLDGAGSRTFQSVSVYFDRFPEKFSMELNLAPGGVLNDPQNILKENGPASGSEEPVLRINHAKEINLYSAE